MITHLLNVTVEVWRLTSAPDGQGGWLEAPAYHHDERARISTPSWRDTQVAAQWSADLTYVAYLDPGADVVRGDELRGAEITRYEPPLEVLAQLPPSEPHHLKLALSTSQAARAETA